MIKLRYIGDVLLATPAIHAIKEAYPQAQITVVVNRGTQEVLAGNPHVHEVLPLEKGTIGAQWKLISGLRGRRFDAAIDLTDADRSAFLAWISGAAVRIGFNDEARWRGWCYTDVVSSNPSIHRIDRDLAALEPLHVAPSNRAPRLWLKQEEESEADELLRRLGAQGARLVVIQPGARYWFKAWPAERFAELADRVTRQYQCQVLVGGSPQEVELAGQVARTAKRAPLVLAGRASLRLFAAVLKRASLFVGNDSGAMHMASAVGTPVVALFGPSNPREWGPRGGPVEVIYKGIDCRVCFHPTCRRGDQNCMQLISVEEVMEAVGRLLGR
ncbi:putative Lipopolysaccharide heptosyltransferase III [Nitrospira sp. KM1]|uniref:putative lipopolysaccharide heptosyltransferase III n=1 Tax=Nitrospira sp. KM1 TaxID=1936990 RepID=UPI0013A744B7|nr:putative lipopolysaccharide heptosyltransferase III [Nitrospira sp. KM1]BCA54237.1 putative Lipopolysaccharide heptosyltransferase III [Nitrospira sp. KM1]